MDTYRLEAAPGAPWLQTIVDNRDNRSVLAVHDNTPVIANPEVAKRLLDSLNANPVD